MHYQHRWYDGEEPVEGITPGKIICVGRNYAAHAAELGNEIPEEPVLFMKPSTAFQSMSAGVSLTPRTEPVHYELEIAVLIGETLSHATREQARQAVMGFGLGLDLTLRETQTRLKHKGYPWERAKAFDGSCPMSPFVSAEKFNDWQSVTFHLSINQQVKQQGHTAHMLFPIEQLLIEISKQFTLLPGDVVLTGTPEGVGALSEGDHLFMTLADELSCRTDITFQGGA